MAIDRRTLLTAAGSAVLLAPASVRAERTAENKKVPWAFLYWMPYDNDLSPHAKPVIDQLVAGTRNTGLAVAVQADTPGRSTMLRFVLSGAGVRSEPAGGHDSASAEELAQFLEWGVGAILAENYVVVVLGHGGDLTEISQDQSTNGWMGMDDLAAALRRCGDAIGAKPALLYLQNCNKGTIETYYQLRDCARVTLAAQSLLGAPNFYYGTLLNWLNGYSNAATPMEVARRIAEFERHDMLTTIVGTDNIKLGDLPRRLRPVLEAVRATGVRTLQRSDVVTYSYPDAKGEQYADLITLLAGFSSRFDAVRDHYMTFTTWLWGVMGARRIDGTMAVPTLQGVGLQGIGILMPRSAEEYERYRSHPFYAATRFWDYVPYRVAGA